MVAHEPADAPAKRQTRNTRGGNNPAGGGQTEGLCLVVELAPGDARFGADGAAFHIHTDAFHGREINHQPTVAESIARDVVTAAANGHQHTIGSSKIDRMDNVGNTDAAGDESRSFVDHHIKTCAGFVVSIVARTQQITAHTGAEFLDHCLVEHNIAPRHRYYIDEGHNGPLS